MIMPAQPLVWRVVRGLLQLSIVMAATLALSAWSMTFWRGWTFLLTFIGCSALLTGYIARRDPALLERRMQSGPTAEQEPSQKIIQSINGLLFFALLAVSGLDHRFGWSEVGSGSVLLGHILMVIAFAGWLLVFRENSFASAIIQISPNQRVIDSGSYALVRHPMYATGLLLFLGMPLALGSYWALFGSLALVPSLIARLLEEERFLDRNLEGYLAYRQKVRWRLVPKLW